MSSGGKRGGAGERVLEGRHVIGLFFLMLLFSGVFFTLGYVMGRSQYDGQVRAANNVRTPGGADVPLKPDVAVKGSPGGNSPVPGPDSASPTSDWEFYHAGDSKPAEDRLKPEPGAKPVAAVARNDGSTKTTNTSTKAPSNTRLLPAGAYSLQVAALTKESDAFDLATRLQKKKFPAYVLSPRADKYYRVQVGPYTDPKAAEAAKKGLEGAGFKAIVKH